MMHPLPYHDTKPVGAADFYFGINAAFRFHFLPLELAAALVKKSAISCWNGSAMSSSCPMP